MPNLATFFFRDEDGVETSMKMWTEETDPNSVATLDVVAALSAASAAALDRWEIAIDGTPTTPQVVGSGAYDIADKAVLEFLDSQGNVYKFAWPAPTQSIFSDSDNINLADLAIDAVEAAVVQAVRTRGGESLQSPALRGYRTRSPRRL